MSWRFELVLDEFRLNIGVNVDKYTLYANVEQVNKLFNAYPYSTSLMGDALEFINRLTFICVEFQEKYCNNVELLKKEFNKTKKN